MQNMVDKGVKMTYLHQKWQLAENFQNFMSSLIISKSNCIQYVLPKRSKTFPYMIRGLNTVFFFENIENCNKITYLNCAFKFRFSCNFILKIKSCFIHVYCKKKLFVNFEIHLQIYAISL